MRTFDCTGEQVVFGFMIPRSHRTGGGKEGRVESRPISDFLFACMTERDRCGIIISTRIADDR